MILAFLILLSFQLLGEAVVHSLNLFIPGPVLGMVLFFVALLVKPALKEKVEVLSRSITAHLALFFVPAGVGVIEYFDLFGRYGVGMVVTILISTVITLGVTALIFHQLMKVGSKGGPA
ncbi:CidA/LrgA family protein [Bdellovibrio sp.]|uniref:CidA/LrgA family protein n=1 Tax=Bdellovibrio TaxID=958 RepID=UPI003221603C